jgi:hypothetical protein
MPKKKKTKEKIYKLIPLSQKINGISLDIGSAKENLHQKSPHILDLNELIKKQREKNIEKISSKNFFKETLYGFWANKKIETGEETEENKWKNFSESAKIILKLIAKKIIDLPQKIKTKLIDIKLSWGKRKLEGNIDFTTSLYYKPTVAKQIVEEKSKIKIIGKKKIIDHDKINELAIVNLIQLLFFIIISFIKLIGKIFSFLNGILRPITARINKLIPPSLKERFRILKIKLEPVFNLEPPEGWHKSLAGFAVISIIIALPLQAFTYYEQIQDSRTKIINSATKALGQLKLGQKAAGNFDLDSAKEEFLKAEESFTTAQNEINQINLIITNIIGLIPEEGKTFKSGELLIVAGKNISEINQLFTEIIKGISETEISLVDKIISTKEKLKIILPKIEKTINNLSNIDNKIIPEEDREAFLIVQNSLPLLKKSLEEFISISDLFSKILGEERTKRYLIVFQNNSEIRPTGGFIGSFALVDLDRGKIKKLEVPAGGSYDLQGSLIEKVISPEPLHLINPHWQFHDANWFPDFPASARKLIWFYEKSGGPSVDGVIAINATFARDLLKITGPIPMPEYKKVIDEQNFILETQKAVEIEYKEENKPKQFLADLSPKLIDKILNLEKGKSFDLLILLQGAFQTKDIMLYSTESKIERSILDLGLGGEIKFTGAKNDYLFVVNANVAGGKTDLNIKQKIKHQSEVLDDGSIIDNLSITRTHEGKKGDLFTGLRNIDYLRVYVPEGSILLEAKGFEKPASTYFENPDTDYKNDSDLEKIEGGATLDSGSNTIINNEFGKTVFGNWMQLEPGETKTVILRYKLPFKMKSSPKFIDSEETWLDKIKKLLEIYEEEKNLIYYTFLIQKQSGVANTEFSSAILLPKKLKVLFKYPSDLAIDENNKLQFNTELRSDQSFGLIFEEK